MSDMVTTNLKQQGRLFGFMGHALYRVAGESIANGVMEEFEQLVIETAQYTGTTAASWNVGTMGAASHGNVRARGLGPDEAPLQVGHGAAVSVAMNANEGRLDELKRGTIKALNSGVNVWNEAPGAERATTGPLRRVNAGAETAFTDFKQRVMSKVFIPLAQNYTPEQIVALAKEGGKI